MRGGNVSTRFQNYVCWKHDINFYERLANRGSPKASSERLLLGLTLGMFYLCLHWIIFIFCLQPLLCDIFGKIWNMIFFQNHIRYTYKTPRIASWRPAPWKSVFSLKVSQEVQGQLPSSILLTRANKSAVARDVWAELPLKSKHWQLGKLATRCCKKNAPKKKWSWFV